MRTAVLLLTALIFFAIESTGSRTRTRNVVLAAVRASRPGARIDFDSQIKPILKSQCMPCHFSGGKMYERLPFDQPQTIRKLGSRLFTRIKGEDDRRIIEAFLKQPEKE